MEAGGNFLRRHPRLELALFLSVLGCYIFVGCWMIRGPPEFSATVTSFEGLDRSTSTAGAAAAPTFRVDLRVKSGSLLLQASGRWRGDRGVRRRAARPRRPRRVLRAGAGRRAGPRRGHGRRARAPRPAPRLAGEPAPTRGAGAVGRASEAGRGARGAA